MKTTIKIKESALREAIEKTLNENVEIGSISQRTMRIEDLIPKFLSVLNREEPEFVKNLLEEYQDLKKALVDKKNGVRSEWWDTEEASYVLNEIIFDEMDSIAPEGCYFGSNEGDGADFGFWPYDVDESINRSVNNAVKKVLKEAKYGDDTIGSFLVDTLNSNIPEVSQFRLGNVAALFQQAMRKCGVDDKTFVDVNKTVLNWILKDKDEKILRESVKKVLTEGQYDDNIVKKWIYWCYNYHRPEKWMDIFNGPKEHFMNKFNHYYDLYGADGVMNAFFVNLDNENQNALIDYVMNNY